MNTKFLKQTTLLTVASFSGFLVLSGCGSSGLPATVPVSGTVTYKGKPVEGANILFGRGGRDMAQGELAVGKTDAEGRFELTTHFGSKASAKGIVPGEYEVTISKHVPPPGISEAQYKAVLDAANKISETGGMVPTDKQPPPLVEMFPPRYAISGKSELKASVSPEGTDELKFELK